MNGIAGIIGSPAHPSAPACLPQMVERLCHEPGDVATHGVHGHLSLGLGWVTGHGATPLRGPVWSRRHQVGVALLGEEFSAGRNGSSGTTVAAAFALAEAFEVEGNAAFGSLNGWFSGVLIDVRDHSVTLFNDRFGRGRIYYHESSEGFFFSSEAKSLLAVRPELRRLDPRGVAEMFAVGCVMQNRSLYAGISLLPPGSAWRFQHGGGVQKRTYFDRRSWEEQPPLSSLDYIQRLRDVLARIAPRYVLGRRRVGLSLTGGLDSRAVMAWAKSDPGDLPCYTFGGPYRDCADVRIARRLAAACRHPHTTIRVRDEFFTDFGRLAERTVYLSDGTMDVSGAVELHVNRQARELAPVRLTGNYGSEILRQHVAFRPRPVDASLLEPVFAERLREAAETYAAEAAGHPLSFIAFKQVPWHHHARFAIEKSQLMPRSPFLDNDLVALAFQAPPAIAGSAQPLLHLIAAGNPSLAKIATDRAYRLNSIPFFTTAATAWQEFTARAEYAYDYGMPRWLVRADRNLTSLHLEKLFLGRHKFYHFRIWYRDQLRGFVRNHGGESASLPWYREGAPRRIIDEHLSSRSNHTLELHRLLTLQLTERLLLGAS